MARQLILDLPVRPALGRDDFFVSPANALALSVIDAPRDWPQGKLLLVGPEGAGKTHLTQVFAHDHGAAVVPAAALDPARVAELAEAGTVAVEDADRIAGDAAAETALFHLHNLVLSEGGRLLLTARTAPQRWPLSLPDLASRMQATQIALLDPPDDALLAAVLVKQFADRQLLVPATLVPWLVARMERSLAAARDLVAALDAQALAQGRPIGQKLAAEVLDRLRPSGQ
ncbi:DnaA ATPase domain-containing protein [Albidovulum sediminis]|uniref:DnaA/Hda family protein n=1 Tax=Albidovulum sediminis TaxID=3066345 RepID=A0ABT2NND5_9RHOB|nr:DnaA/Hda family protein [Defluviimonas sediminis]MCT8330399.1 DnaA/Hda family protein [Defluviimonas sediminis]